MTQQSNNTLKIALPGYWGSFIPPLQHTFYGAILIENQFETLVRRGRFGVLEPLAAKSWDISSDYTSITFTIDTNRQFSDGSYLCAADFKKAWQDGLLLEKKAANQSLHDFFYFVVGFEEFQSTKELAGVSISGKDKLTIKFKKPFRIGLDHLTGKRLSVFKNINNEYIGTGAYIIKEDDQKVATLTPNPHWKGDHFFKNISLQVIPKTDGMRALLDGSIDVLQTAQSYDLTNHDSIGLSVGEEANHIIMHLNALKGRLFSNPKHRRAMQFIVHKVLRQNPEFRKILQQRFSIIDPQTYLEHQAGRLSVKFVNDLITVPEQDLKKLQEDTKKHPLYFISIGGILHQALKQELINQKINFSENHSEVDFVTMTRMLYKTYEPDIIFAGFSVLNGDPDGIYHALGKNGAIFSPMTYKEQINQLLESGRSIIDRDRLAPHYQEVSKEILKEVPYIHIGFAHQTIAYRKNKVSIDQESSTTFKPPRGAV